MLLDVVPAMSDAQDFNYKLSQRWCRDDTALPLFFEVGGMRSHTARTLMSPLCG